MSTLSPHLIGVLTVTSGLAFSMVWLGARMNLLEHRPIRRRCPSCGLTVRWDGVCRCQQ
jgi:hypothetical protein